MEQQWTAYSESNASRQARYAPHTLTTPQQQAQRDPSLPSQMKQESYASPTAPSRTNSMAALPSPGGTLLGQAPDFNDRDGDIAMEDADPYKPKYTAARPNHQHRHSQQFLQQVQQEESSAARRYSPMNLSPTSPYSGNPQQGGQNYTSFTPQAQQSNRQSPTRNNPYMSSPNNFYSPPCKLSLVQHALLSARVLIITTYSFSASCPSTSSYTVQHESRYLLPAVSDCAIERCLQPRGAITSNDQPQSPTAAPYWTRACPKVRKVRKYGRSAANHQPTAAISPCAS